MAKQLTPVQIVAAFNKWHVDLKLYPGYATRGYGPGSISDPQGILIHHTGSDSQSDQYLEFLFEIGRPGDVPAPLCNWATDFDGDVWLGAAERANHAGMGSSATLAKVKTDGYDHLNAEIHPGTDDINGNSKYYGNEVRFDGGQPMTAAQWNSVILSCAAICDAHGWGAWRVIAHREHTRRKPDPGSTLMYKIRRDVAAALKAGPGNWPVVAPGNNPLPAKDMIDMASPDQVAGAVTKGTAAYWRDFYDPKKNGTGAEMRAEQAAQAKAQLAATNAQTEAIKAQTAAFERFAAAVTAAVSK